MGKKNDPPRVEVHTNKRSYSVLKGGKVAWEKGEKVKKMEAKGGKK